MDARRGDHADARLSAFGLDAIHTYHYIPDVAAGLAKLGCAEADVCSRPWMLPCAPAGTLRELVDQLATTMGQGIHMRPLPRWVLKTIAAFSPLFRELDEMRYQWDEPFVVDDRRFRERFGLTPVPVDRAAADKAEWAQRHYGPRRRGTSS